VQHALRIYTEEARGATVEERLRDTVHRLNTLIIKTLDQQDVPREQRSAATLELVVVVEEAGKKRAHIAHVGDSQTWLVRNGVSYLLTEDQSLVQRLVALGRITPEQARRHEQRNVIANGLGLNDALDNPTDPSTVVQVRTIDLLDGDVLLAVSDGFTDPAEWNHTDQNVLLPRNTPESLGTDQGIPGGLLVAAVEKGQGDAEHTAQSLVSAVRPLADSVSRERNYKNGVDNISAGVYIVRPSVNPPAPVVPLVTNQELGPTPLTYTARQNITRANPLKLGRQRDENHILFSVDGVSLEHAQVYLENGAWWIEDLKTVNGTYVGFDKLSAPVPRRLGPKQVVSLGVDAQVVVTIEPTGNTITFSPLQGIRQGSFAAGLPIALGGAAFIPGAAAVLPWIGGVYVGANLPFVLQPAIHWASGKLPGQAWLTSIDFWVTTNTTRWARFLDSSWLRFLRIAPFSATVVQDVSTIVSFQGGDTVAENLAKLSRLMDRPAGMVGIPPDSLRRWDRFSLPSGAVHIGDDIGGMPMGIGKATGNEAFEVTIGQQTYYLIVTGNRGNESTDTWKITLLDPSGRVVGEGLTIEGLVGLRVLPNGIGGSYAQLTALTDLTARHIPNHLLRLALGIPQKPLALPSQAPYLYPSMTPEELRSRPRWPWDQRTFFPSQKSITMGRSAGQTISLRDDPSVSRTHASIAFDDTARRWYLADSSSSLGTWVNGTRIDKTFILEPNTVYALRMGKTMMDVWVDDSGKLTVSKRTGRLGQMEVEGMSDPKQSIVTVEQWQQAGSRFRDTYSFHGKLEEQVVDGQPNTNYTHSHKVRQWTDLIMAMLEAGIDPFGIGIQEDLDVLRVAFALAGDFHDTGNFMDLRDGKIIALPSQTHAGAEGRSIAIFTHAFERGDLAEYLDKLSPEKRARVVKLVPHLIDGTNVGKYGLLFAEGPNVPSPLQNAMRLADQAASFLYRGSLQSQDPFIHPTITLLLEMSNQESTNIPAGTLSTFPNFGSSVVKSNLMKQFLAAIRNFTAAKGEETVRTLLSLDPGETVEARVARVTVQNNALLTTFNTIKPDDITSDSVRYDGVQLRQWITDAFGLSREGPLTSRTETLPECVTGDTALKKRRRKKRPDGTWEDVWDDVPIKDIEEGDEILSLNEATGTFAPATVKKLMHKGVQTVWKLTTASGKTIRTTSEHPYLVPTIGHHENSVHSGFIDETGITNDPLQPKIGVGLLTVTAHEELLNRQLRQIFLEAVHTLGATEKTFEFK
ncbi:FHA domain-containing protein, partial [Candidatus Gottesmanbacteria bacterium]|nr:FHA domain-containing protein [Candidatus Gottesmanbacteria bacterium]